MFELTGKTALVTGATGGIGGTIARALHERAQRSPFPERGARSSIGSPVNSASASMCCPCDLADPAETDALVPRAEEAMGQLDILVANAGVTRDNLLVQLRDEDWDQVIAINLSATFRLTRAAVRGMMRRRFGRVIAHHLGGGRDRQSRPGQLRRRQSRHHRHDQSDGGRNMPSAASPPIALRPVSSSRPMTEKLNDKQREAIVAKIPASRPAPLKRSRPRWCFSHRTRRPMSLARRCM